MTITIDKLNREHIFYEHSTAKLAAKQNNAMDEDWHYVVKELAKGTYVVEIYDEDSLLVGRL